MKDQKGKQRGLTLMELVIVLAVIAVLVAIVVPSVTGYLGRGKERAYEADKRILQEAVDAWRSDTRHRLSDPWPLLGSAATPGTPTACYVGDVALHAHGSGAEHNIRSLPSDNF